MDNNNIYKKLKMRIAISKKIEEDIVMKREKTDVLKNIGIELLKTWECKYSI